MRKIYLIILYITVSTILAQQTLTTGNLLRINFHSKEINFDDTLWNWYSQKINKEAISERCIGGFTINAQDYLLIAKSKFNPSIEWYWFYLINISKSIKWFLYERANYIDANQLYLYFRPKLLPMNNGTWILFGIDRTALFLQMILYMKVKLIILS